jgi:hypothetical protein
MSEDRKYRQRGYQDDRERDRPKSPAPRAPREERDGPRTPNLMGSHEVFRCGRCARIQTAAVGLEDRCPQCGVDLHSCVQCVSFDPGSTFECMQVLTARVTFERQTGSTPAAGPVSAQQAFDDLFKF